MSAQIIKKQHYVPQFLLKGFDVSETETSKVHIFDVERVAIRQNQAIKDVFTQNYFYDRENKVENFISSNIEGPASAIINQFRCLDFSNLNSEGTELIKFICCQNCRTVESREDALNFTNASFHQIVSDISRLNSLDISDPTKFKISPSNKDSMRNFNAELALSGVIDSKGMEDLRFHILKNQTDTDFIISDHAVCRYNWLYRNLNDPRVGSQLARGVQLFIPLSSRLYLCAYDPKVYKYGTRSSDVSDLINFKDVDWLNQLQMRFACSFIAFSSLKMKAAIYELHALYYGKKIFSRKSTHLGQKELEHNKLRTTHLVYTEQIKLKYKPTFFKIIKSAKKHSQSFEERDPAVSQALMMLKREIYEKRKHANRP